MTPHTKTCLRGGKNQPHVFCGLQPFYATSPIKRHKKEETGDLLPLLQPSLLPPNPVAAHSPHVLPPPAVVLLGVLDREPALHPAPVGSTQEPPWTKGTFGGSSSPCMLLLS